ncbi:MAG: TldE/PmbA family protein [Deltaproteobacteria bacterium]|nr:TldE/PmbA family protein [Deltaproteobacteria bacterium]
MSQDHQSFFYTLFEYAQGKILEHETLLASFYAEESSFVRFNSGQIRQPGSVSQTEFTLELVDDKKHLSATFSLSQNDNDDKQTVDETLATLRENLQSIPDDPHFLYATEVNSSENSEAGSLPTAQEITEEILAEGAGLDFVGILAHGSVACGFANSLGQRNWFTRDNFNFDWSVYSHEDKAIKSGYSGFEWDRDILSAKFTHARKHLDILKLPPKTLEPGEYKVFLTPAALSEVLGLLGWFSFSKKAVKTKQSALLTLVEEQCTLHPSVHINENNNGGVGPMFNSKGFVKESSIELVSKGLYSGALTSARSAREYDVPTDGSNAGETPESLELGAGKLLEKDILTELGDGLYISNLWYMNFSDRQSCRMTGMTRFATFWVEDGKIKAPVNVMRFDESLYRMLGENLVGLTQDREHILDAGTYHRRSTNSINLPGALIEGFRLTL